MVEKREDAVSPVVGVMLMLVVVIIIAGVVTMFSTGLMENTEKAPTVQMSYMGVIPGELEGTDSKMGLVFRHDGGEEIDIRMLTFQLKNSVSKDEVTIDFADDIYKGSGSPSETECFGTPGAERMYILGEPAGDLKYIFRAGDRLCIVPDIYAKENSRKNVTYIADRGGTGMNFYSNGTFPLSPITEYKLVDQGSKAIISSGQLTGAEL